MHYSQDMLINSDFRLHISQIDLMPQRLLMAAQSNNQDIRNYARSFHCIWH